MKKYTKYGQYLTALITAFAMVVNYNKIYEQGLKEACSGIMTVSPLLGGIILFSILIFYYKFNKKEYRINWIQKILSCFMGIAILVGISYDKTDSFDLLTKNKTCIVMAIIGIIGYSAFFGTIFKFLNYYIKSSKLKEIITKNANGKSRLIKIFEKYPFRVSLVTILAFWTIYIVAFYPGILTPDGSYQILQAYNIHTVYADWVVQLDPNVNITNHHPVLYTFFIGACVKCGQALKNDNLGIFFATIIQTGIIASILSYTIKYLKRIGISHKLRSIVLLIYCIVPMFPFYAITNVKDTIYTGLIILYVIMLYDYIKFNNKPIKIGKMFAWFAIISLIALLRNNGIYLVLASFIFIVFYNKKNMKKLGALLIIFVILYITYSKLILPYFKITDTSKREMLSVPFQQTARYVKEYEDDVTEEEKEVIDKILGYKNLAERYNPELADPVKNKYNKYAQDEDLNKYFKVWYTELLKHPKCYVEAFVNNTYGYIYPTDKNWYLYYNKLDTINEKGNINYTYNDAMQGLRDKLVIYGRSFKSIPGIGLISNIGFNAWLIFIYGAYFIKNKGKRKYCIVLIPHIISWVFCLLSPVNNYFRYAMPYIFAMPLTTMFFAKEMTDVEDMEK
jgi:hypothetical protein